MKFVLKSLHIYRYGFIKGSFVKQGIKTQVKLDKEAIHITTIILMIK